MDNLPFVTVIIPTRNEEFHIVNCIESIINNDYPIDRLEVLVIDGHSNDRTIQYVKTHFNENIVKILFNDKKIFPAAINIGVNNAKGDILIIAGAHAIYNKNYISLSVKYLTENDVENVGGYVLQKWPDTSYVGESIITALSSTFGVGISVYKTARSDTLKFVDTVFGGCYKKSVFNEIGLFNENFIYSSDIEFNYRLRKNGGRILFVPEIESTYYYRRDRTKYIGFIKHNFRNGFWTVYPLRYVKNNPFSLKHHIPILFVFGLFGPLLLFFIYKPFLLISAVVFISYLIVNLFYTFNTQSKVVYQYLILPFIFMSLHLSYGIGSMWALIKLFCNSFCFFRIFQGKNVTRNQI